jgi:hypothetical protein
MLLTHLLSLVVAFGVLSSEDKAVIAWKPTEGHKTAVRIVLAGRVSDTDLETRLRADSTVVKVGEDGSVTLRTIYTTEALFMNGQPADRAMIGEPSEYTFRLKPNGEVVSIEAKRYRGDPWFLETDVFVYPNREVAKGETWTLERKGDPNKGVRDSITKFTFLGSEEVEGELAHRVQVEYREVEGEKPLKYTGTRWISASNGDLIKLEARLENVPGGPSPVSVTVRAQRIRE